MKLIPRHQPFEQVANSSSPEIDFFKWCRQQWHFICHSLVANQEPQAWQQRDRNDDFSWYAYAPMSQRSLHSATEDEVRRWMDQRVYQNNGERQ